LNKSEQDATNKKLENMSLPNNYSFLLQHQK